jgi:hypothetical protein
MNISVSSTSDACQFLEIAKRWLDQDEPGNNTILSIANQAGASGSLLGPPFWFAYSIGPNGDCGAAAFALPDGLVLSDMPRKHCIAIVEELLRTGIAPERIYASKCVAPVAASLISTATGRTFYSKRRWRALSLDRIIDHYACASGELRRADGGDIDTVIELGNQYDLENPSVVKVANYFLSRLQEGDLYFWVAEDPRDIRSVLALSGRTDRVIRIAGVFTPEKYRGNRYASSSIVRASNQCLASGYEAVTLVVDTSDSVAVDIYLRLGFKPVHDRLELIVE